MKINYTIKKPDINPKYIIVVDYPYGHFKNGGVYELEGISNLEGTRIFYPKEENGFGIQEEYTRPATEQEILEHILNIF